MRPAIPQHPMPVPFLIHRRALPAARQPNLRLANQGHSHHPLFLFLLHSRRGQLLQDDLQYLHAQKCSPAIQSLLHRDLKERRVTARDALAFRDGEDSAGVGELHYLLNSLY